MRIDATPAFIGFDPDCELFDWRSTLKLRTADVAETAKLSAGRLRTRLVDNPMADAREDDTGHREGPTIVDLGDPDSVAAAFESFRFCQGRGQPFVLVDSLAPVVVVDVPNIGILKLEASDHHEALRFAGLLAGEI